MRGKLIKAAAALVCAATLAGCAQAPSEPREPLQISDTPAYEEGSITPPFWVAEDEATGAQIFLLGSMHAGKSGDSYPDYVLEAFENSSWAAAEMDTLAFSRDAALQNKCAGYLTLSGSAQDVMGGLYQEAVEFFQSKGLYQPVMDRMIPFYWVSAASSLVIDQAGLDTSVGTEAVFLQLARSQNKEIIEIEGGEAQYKMMGGIPMSVQLGLLSEALGDDMITAQAEESAELYEAWSSFDEDYLRGLTVFDPDQVDSPEDWQTYYDMMYTDRQKLMSEFIINRLEGGELGFVFVGTMHFYAEPSILSQLSDAGYTVRKLCPDRNSGSAAA